jgi:hypothetical protein
MLLVPWLASCGGSSLRGITTAREAVAWVVSLEHQRCHQRVHIWTQEPTGGAALSDRASTGDTYSSRSTPTATNS